MQLILTVEKAPQPELVGSRWHCGADGGTLGRASHCDFVLPDPQRYISSLQAVIERHRDGFRIVDHSTNGTYHNAPQTLIGKNRSVALEDGDRLYLGDFVLRVTIEAADARPAKEDTVADPPANDSDAEVSAPNPAEPKPEDWNIGEFSLPWEGSDTAPDQDRKTGAQVDDDIGYSQSPEREYFAPPSPSSGHGDAIPDDWDDFLTGFHDLGGVQSKPAAAEPTEDRVPPEAKPKTASDAAPGKVEAAAFGPDEDDAEDQSEQDRSESALLPDAAAPTPPVDTDPQPPAPAPDAQAASPAPAAARPRPARREALPPAAQPPAEQTPAEQAPAEQQRPGSDDSTRDEILHLVTEGLMALLRGRSEIKSEFRIEQTRIVQIENNPLKFSPNADEALKRVLGQSEASGFLTGARAYQDALEDLQAHQLAILSAVQRAIESVIEQFDPAQLEARLKRISPLSAKTPLLRAAKCWNLFTLHYDDVAGKMREDARQLFMAEFGAAYEDACRQIVASRGKQSRSEQ